MLKRVNHGKGKEDAQDPSVNNDTVITGMHAAIASRQQSVGGSRWTGWARGGPRRGTGRGEEEEGREEGQTMNIRGKKIT